LVTATSFIAAAAFSSMLALRRLIADQIGTARDTRALPVTGAVPRLENGGATGERHRQFIWRRAHAGHRRPEPKASANWGALPGDAIVALQDVDEPRPAVAPEK
jgi:hypothetical protein